MFILCSKLSSCLWIKMFTYKLKVQNLVYFSIDLLKRNLYLFGKLLTKK